MNLAAFMRAVCMTAHTECTSPAVPLIRPRFSGVWH